MNLIELFNKLPSDVSWKIISSDSFMVKYEITINTISKPIIYILKFDEYRTKSNVWKIIFFIKNPEQPPEDIYGLSNTGSATKIFSAVADCMIDFLSKNKAKGFTFSASEPSRKKLYNVFAKKIANFLGWKVIEDQGQTTSYFIVDPSYKNSELFEGRWEEYDFMNGGCYVLALWLYRKTKLPIYGVYDNSDFIHHAFVYDENTNAAYDARGSTTLEKMQDYYNQESNRKLIIKPATKEDVRLHVELAIEAQQQRMFPRRIPSSETSKAVERYVSRIPSLKRLVWNT